MKTNICLNIMTVLCFVFLGINAEDTKKETSDWIKVPWSNGGHYWHNVATREDRDTPPPMTEL
jgi:hypothetical protein